MSAAPQEAAGLIAAGDRRIYAIPSQTSDNDKTSLLGLQNFVAARRPGYTYVEIGSHLGGTLVPHLWDGRCGSIISIDPRPQSQPDERGQVFTYQDNSTARMLATLRDVVPEGCLRKLKTHDVDARDLPVGDIDAKADLALIDGEHTNIAAFSDFVSLLRVLSRDAVIAFHDSNLITDALANVERLLVHLDIPHKSFVLPDCVFVVATGAFAVPAKEAFSGTALNRSQFEETSRTRIRNIMAQRALSDGSLPFKSLRRATWRRVRNLVARA